MVALLLTLALGRKLVGEGGVEPEYLVGEGGLDIFVRLVREEGLEIASLAVMLTLI